MPADIIESPAPTRAQIQRLQDAALERPQIDIEPSHTFGPGFYARTINIPGGATLVGKVHATEHIFILSRGSLAVATEDGVQILHAPFQCVCRPGLKRAGTALSDCTVTNVHITEQTDLNLLEAELIVPDAIGYAADKRLGG